MDKITFSTDLETNIRLMQAIFQGDNTFVVRRAVGHKGLSCAVFFFDGMVNSVRSFARTASASPPTNFPKPSSK